MAEIVAAVATTHTPGLLGWFESAPVDQQVAALAAFARLREHLRAARPDVLVIFANDHLLNWPINNTPEYTVGIGEWHVGPADWYDEWLSRKEKYRIPGHSSLACYIVNQAARRGLSLAYLRDMQFDDSISVPVCYLDDDAAIPLVPISMNCSVPPIPTPRRAYEVGGLMGEMLRNYPGPERIALIGSGGLSHEPGGPRYFHIDEAFDRRFLELLVEGDHDKLMGEITLERMEEAGSGGTAELIAWFVVLAATCGPAEVVDYLASYAWRCASGWVIWHHLC